MFVDASYSDIVEVLFRDDLFVKPIKFHRKCIDKHFEPDCVAFKEGFIDKMNSEKLDCIDDFVASAVQCSKDVGSSSSRPPVL